MGNAKTLQRGSRPGSCIAVIEIDECCDFFAVFPTSDVITARLSACIWISCKKVNAFVFIGTDRRQRLVQNIFFHLCFFGKN